MECRQQKKLNHLSLLASSLASLPFPLLYRVRMNTSTSFLLRSKWVHSLTMLQALSIRSFIDNLPMMSSILRSPSSISLGSSALLILWIELTRQWKTTSCSMLFFLKLMETTLDTLKRFSQSQVSMIISLRYPNSSSALLFLRYSARSGSILLIGKSSPYFASSLTIFRNTSTLSKLASSQEKVLAICRIALRASSIVFSGLWQILLTIFLSSSAKAPTSLYFSVQSTFRLQGYSSFLSSKVRQSFLRICLVWSSSYLRLRTFQQPLTLSSLSENRLSMYSWGWGSSSLSSSVNSSTCLASWDCFLFTISSKAGFLRLGVCSKEDWRIGLIWLDCRAFQWVAPLSSLVVGLFSSWLKYFFTFILFWTGKIVSITLDSISSFLGLTYFELLLRTSICALASFLMKFLRSCLGSNCIFSTCFFPSSVRQIMSSSSGLLSSESEKAQMLADLSLQSSGCLRDSRMERDLSEENSLLIFCSKERSSLMTFCFFFAKALIFFSIFFSNSLRSLKAGVLNSSMRLTSCRWLARRQMSSFSLKLFSRIEKTRLLSYSTLSSSKISSWMRQLIKLRQRRQLGSLANLRKIESCVGSWQRIANIRSSPYSCLNSGLFLFSFMRVFSTSRFLLLFSVSSLRCRKQMLKRLFSELKLECAVFSLSQVSWRYLMLYKPVSLPTMRSETTSSSVRGQSQRQEAIFTKVPLHSSLSSGRMQKTSRKIVITSWLSRVSRDFLISGTTSLKSFLSIKMMMKILYTVISSIFSEFTDTLLSTECLLISLRLWLTSSSLFMVSITRSMSMWMMLLLSINLRISYKLPILGKEDSTEIGQVTGYWGVESRREKFSSFSRNYRQGLSQAKSKTSFLMQEALAGNEGLIENFHRYIQ